MRLVLSSDDWRLIMLLRHIRTLVFLDAVILILLQLVGEALEDIILLVLREEYSFPANFTSDPESALSKHRSSYPDFIYFSLIAFAILRLLALLGVFLIIWE